MSGQVTALIELRRRTGKSRATVAGELGVSERHLLRLEMGHQPITRRWAHVFASYYGVDASELEREVAA